MADDSENKPAPAPSRCRRVIKWAAFVLFLAGCAWMALWFTERSLNSHRRQRRLQSWLDERLNADVSLLRQVRVHLNPLRSSRLTASDIEIEHPNVIFPGKFVILRQASVWTEPLALLGVSADRLRVRLDGLKMAVEENDSREWSAAGLLDPIMQPDKKFPYPVPSISGWELRLANSVLFLRRRGFELALNLDLAMASAGSNRVILQPTRIPFTLRRDNPDGEYHGEITSSTASFKILAASGADLELAPEHCEFKVSGLPLAILPFFMRALPIDELPGEFHGMIRFEDSPEGGMAAVCEGEIRDASLSIVGLPRSAPIRIVWPLGDLVDRTASVRMGPAGYGGFDLRIPFDSQGAPKMLEMHGDVGALSDVPQLFSAYLPWLEWLSRTFPVIEWKAGSWLGFGWSGENLSVTLSRATAGMNVFGEGEMLGGRVRVAMNPGHGDGLVTIAAERLDPQLLAVKLTQLLPDNWRIAMKGDHTNLTWRGYPPGDERERDWAATLVFSRPRIDLDNSGVWWLGLRGIIEAAAQTVRLRGGTPEALDKLAASGELAPEQFSVVAVNDETGLEVEFLSHGGALGEVGGEIRRDDGGAWKGALTMVGPSETLAAAKADDPAFGRVLEILAAMPDGLPTGFAEDDKGGIGFHYRFLDDARRLEEEFRAAERTAK
ncbi:MAG: hypothetical protein LBJ46_04430 [Planctomycetota bacterium]|jgi:hypothetical protein|nr:hypothetical protein [Planctomycetota bacterium]